MKKEVEIVINDDGTFTIHTTGVKGITCKNVAKALQKCFPSSKVVSQENTPEMFQQEVRVHGEVKI